MRKSGDMKYILSNRQKKELENGKELLIVMPFPLLNKQEAENLDLKKWVTDHLEVDPKSVYHVYEGHVRVMRSPASGAEIATQIGQICRGNPPPGTLTWPVRVIMAQLCARRWPRGEYPAQWPLDFR